MNYNHISPDNMTKYLAGELETEEKKECELHFAVCPECAAKLDETRRFEQSAKKSYSPDFPDRLDNKDAQQIDMLLHHDLTTETKSSSWSKRVCASAWVQVSSILVMAVLLVVMIVTPKSPAKMPERKIQKTETAIAPVGPVTAEEKKAPVEPEKAVQPQQPEPVTVSAPKTPEPSPALPQPVQQPKKEMKSVLNPGLMRFLHISEISLGISVSEANPDHVQTSCVLSPFEPEVYILAASCGNKEKEIRIEAGADAVMLSDLGSANQKNIRTAALKTGKPDQPFAVIQILDANIPALAVSAKEAIPDFEHAPEYLRLAAVMHAAGNPKLVLNKNTREKMLAELDKLIQGKYANDQAILLFRKQMGRIK